MAGTSEDKSVWLRCDVLDCSHDLRHGILRLSKSAIRHLPWKAGFYEIGPSVRNGSLQSASFAGVGDKHRHGKFRQKRAGAEGKQIAGRDNQSLVNGLIRLKHLGRTIPTRHP